jgi:DNA-binding transcriptional LysR family regulator
VLRACRNEYPDIQLQLTESNAADLIEALCAYQMHFAFLRLPVAHPEALAFETLLIEPSVLALPQDHPIARRYKPLQVVPLQALHNADLILVRRPGAPGFYANLLKCLQEAGVSVRVVAEVERMMSNLNLVASGAGVSIVPASMKGAHGSSVAYRMLPALPELRAPITLVYRKESCGPVTDRFLALARRLASRHESGRHANASPKALAS